MAVIEKPAGGSEGIPMPERRTMAVPLEGVTLRESKSGDGTMHLAGHAAVFDRLSHDLGGFREKLSRGAFSSILDADPDVHLVIGHDMTRVLARTRSKTLELREDPAGLRVWARLDPDDPDVRSLIPKMRRGDVDQMSFAFMVGSDTWVIENDGEDDERVVRTINEVSDLFDVSVVAQGAYPQTDANLRGLLQAAVESGRLMRESVDVSPDESANESEPQGDPALALDEKRTTAEAEPPAGDSPHVDDVGETTRVPNEELEALRRHSRTETELARRRLMAAQRHGR